MNLQKTGKNHKIKFSSATAACTDISKFPSGATSAAICIRNAEHTASGVLCGSSTPAYPADAQFIMYSVTKTIIATAALRYVEKQLLQLDTPIALWLPNIPHASSITLRQLLRHSSGLPDYGGLPQYREAVRNGATPWTDAEYLTNSHAETLLFPPGLGWSYSNIGYMVARMLLETARGAAFDLIVQEEICDPLKLTATHILKSDKELAHLEFGLSLELGTQEQGGNVAEKYHIGWVSHSVAASTVQEISFFFAALFGGALISETLLREMCTYCPLPVMPDRPFIRPGYGMGLQIDHGWADGPLYGNSGGGPGARIHISHLQRNSNPITIAVAAPGENMAQVEYIAAQILKEQLS